MLLQGRRIWHAKSVAVLSIPFMWYAIMFYGILLIYGIDQLRLGMIINGTLRGLTLLPVIAGMIAFHKHSRRECWLVVCFGIILGCMIVLPMKGPIFVAQAFVGLGFFLTQPYAIIRNGQTGVLEIKVLIMAFLSTSFWTWYGHTIDDTIVMYTSLMHAIIQLFTIILFRVYPEYKEQAAAS